MTQGAAGEHSPAGVAVFLLLDRVFSCPPPAVRQPSGVGETISGRRGGGSDAQSGCWLEDVAGSAILGAPGASSRAERRQLVAGAAGRSGRHRMLVGVDCLGV